MAALAGAVRQHLLVGQHRLTGRAPVGRRQPSIGEAVLVELEEPPLRPPVVVGVGGDDLPLPVEDRPHRLELPSHVLDVAGRPLMRVDLQADRRVLGRQAERIESHREEDVVPPHPLVARLHVRRRHRVPVPDVQVAGGVGEHRQGVPFGARVVVARPVELVRLPALPPSLLDLESGYTCRPFSSLPRSPVLRALIVVQVYQQRRPPPEQAIDCPHHRPRLQEHEDNQRGHGGH